jgi:hypothetical protein
VAVTAEIEVPNPEVEGEMMTAPIAGTEIQFLPFDRDAVFDSLTTAFGTPEPPIPQDLLDAQGEIAAAQEEWQAAERAWQAGRDRLLAINQEMEGLNRGESQYNILYQEFRDREVEVNRAERIKDQAFARFNSLQEGYIQRADSMRFIQEQWADEAFAMAFDVFALKARETGQDILADTTDAQGMTLTDVPPGDWWVHAYYELPFSELYWNLPITVIRGEPVQVRLTRETALVRPKI